MRHTTCFIPGIGQDDGRKVFFVLGQMRWVDISCEGPGQWQQVIKSKHVWAEWLAGWWESEISGLCKQSSVYSLNICFSKQKAEAFQIILPCLMKNNWVISEEFIKMSAVNELLILLTSVRTLLSSVSVHSLYSAPTESCENFLFLRLFSSPDVRTRWSRRANVNMQMRERSHGCQMSDVRYAFSGALVGWQWLSC